MAEIKVRNTDHELPSALSAQEEIAGRMRGKRLAVFLDYDGTLTPIVSRPEDAVLTSEMRSVIRDLAAECPVAIISGRDLPDVREKVGIGEIFYAGSHGFDIEGPEGRHLTFQKGVEFLPSLDRAEGELSRRLEGVPGIRIERKKFSVAVHFRQAEERNARKVRELVGEVQQQFPHLRLSQGKKVCELSPGIDWNKGRALLWILQTLKLNKPDVLPFYIGDDITDEDAFAALRERGIGIVVRESDRPSTAQYELKSTEEVREFLGVLLGHMRTRSS